MPGCKCIRILSLFSAVSWLKVRNWASGKELPNKTFLLSSRVSCTCPAPESPGPRVGKSRWRGKRPAVRPGDSPFSFWKAPSWEGCSETLVDLIEGSLGPKAASVQRFPPALRDSRRREGVTIYRVCTPPGGHSLELHFSTRRKMLQGPAAPLGFLPPLQG